MKNFVSTHFNRVFSGLKKSNYSLVAIFQIIWDTKIGL